MKRYRVIRAASSAEGRQRKQKLKAICDDLGFYLSEISKAMKNTDESAFELSGMSRDDKDYIDDLIDKIDRIDTTALKVLLDEYL